MDPITIAHEVETRYRRYLATTFYFRDPAFRASFRQALEKEGLSRGPYIEGTPHYQHGLSVSQLASAILGEQPDPGFLCALKHQRLLYWHQEEAIRRVALGRNVVIATGTGSGKTEAFLYPILLHLYAEWLRGELGPGVRALLLYPMNALAHDQRERLGEIARDLERYGSPFRFTFGQYIGETPEDTDDHYRDATRWEAQRQPGELVFRKEMRQHPPHILITNYSMLEYLLTRPYDSPLFDDGNGATWRFIVLDEVHQYRGAEGAEMASLLRRLKQRLREGGCRKPLRCIATSATLADLPNDARTAARFAQDLFGEPFAADDIICPRTFQVDPATVNRLLEPPVNTLARDLIDRVTGQVVPVQALARQLFPQLGEEEGCRQVAALVERLTQTTDPKTGRPLLSARFHLFLRTLEGAYVQFWPRRQVFIDPNRADGPTFEVALCRDCGQHYLVAPKGFRGGKITAPVRDPSRSDFGVLFLRELQGDSPTDDAQQEWELCACCGLVAPPGRLPQDPRCQHSERIRLVAEPPPPDEERTDQLVRCGFCGYRGRDPVSEVLYGSDGPHAVIATTLVRLLPKERQKVLAFADGRQEAAFFAWYLERTYTEVLNRNLLYQILQNVSPADPDGLSLADLVAELVRALRNLEICPDSMSKREVERLAWIKVYRELLTDAQRLSLEGVALARWEIHLPAYFDLAQLQASLPLSIDRQRLQTLVALLLDSVRADYAVELDTGTGVGLVWDHLELLPAHGILDLASLGRRPGRRSVEMKNWDGPRTRRLDLLTRWLVRSGIPEDKCETMALQLARAVWEWLLGCDRHAKTTQDKLLISQPSGGFRLNPRWFRLHLLNQNDLVYQCQICGRVHPRSLDGVCPRYRCPGSLQPIPLKELEPDHYRELYRWPQLAGPMRVEEHTAQLKSTTARDYQRDFHHGKIQVLSSSTTFELGVDLGDLDVIFLRNVPPGPANYAQRVGRSGRRSGHPGLAITYCQRRPHDLYHFHRPDSLLRGAIRSPVLHLLNQKILRRHMTSQVLSYFFRSHKDRFRNVDSLLHGFTEPSLAKDVLTFAVAHRSVLEMALRQVIPAEAWQDCGLVDGSWVEAIAGPTSRLAVAERAVAADWLSLKRFEEEASRNGRYGEAGWAQRRRRTVEQEDVLSFLSRHAVIPKYGFPVDVVSLDILGETQEAQTVDLQRDLRIAISEFAPANAVVANKSEWVSYGLKRPPLQNREWEKRFYRYCPLCNTFEQWGISEPAPSPQCPHSPRTRKYVIPEFGFVTRRGPARQPSGRRAPMFTSRPYFAGPRGTPLQPLAFPAQHPVILVTPAAPGRLVVLCEGQRGNGFYICPACGAGFAKPPTGSHTDPYGRPCHGRCEVLSLGHEFETDVLALRLLLPIPGGADVTTLTQSVAYALLEGAATVLDAPPEDLNVTVSSGPGNQPWPIILYDDVPGGAGLVGRLQHPEMLRVMLEAARERTNGTCGCRPEESCYGCLRSYRNQFVHHLLSRGLAHQYLTSLLASYPQASLLEVAASSE